MFGGFFFIMSLRNQPYLPLYVQDFLTDEKLAECSAQSTGVYIRLLCIMHKSDEYGKILLKQKDKQTTEQVKNFALKLAKQMPYSELIITESLTELIDEKVIHLDNDYIYQKRMVKDNLISEERSKAGKKGGEFAQAKLKAKLKANSESEDEDECNKKVSVILKDEKYSEFAKHIVYDLMDYYKFTELRNGEKLSEFNRFINVIINTSKHHLFLDNWLSYKAYCKLKTDYKGFNYSNFIGTPTDLYISGGWNSRNWLYETIKLDPTYAKIHVKRVNEIIEKCNLLPK